LIGLIEVIAIILASSDKGATQFPLSITHNIMKILDVYVGDNKHTEREELRIVIQETDNAPTEDLFFGTGLIDGNPPTIDQAEEQLSSDKNWRTRLRVIDRLSDSGHKYRIAVLSDVLHVRSLKF